MRMKLIINKLLDKPGFINALRDVYPRLTFSERVELATNLPFQDEDFYMSAKEMKEKIGKYVEYTYLPVANEDRWAPPWERQDYIDAKAWYDSLPEEDRQKIDVLVRSNQPWG